MIKLFKYKINSITIYATGGVINTNISINIESYKLFLISIAGVLMQLILFITPLRYMINASVFYKINISLIIFNLIPIYPSDGYKVLLSLIEGFTSYSKVIKLSYAISFISLLLLFIDTKSLIIFITLYIINVRYVLEYRYYLEKFFIERYLYGIKYKRKRIVKNLNDLYKCRKNYIKCDNILVEEEEYLSKKYAYFIDI